MKGLLIIEENNFNTIEEFINKKDGLNKIGKYELIFENTYIWVRLQKIHINFY